MSEWEILPDTLVLRVVGYLRVKDVLAAGATCHRWARLCRDNLLWKHLLLRDFGLGKKTPLAVGAESWLEEYIRLTDNVPTVCVQHITGHQGHTDEVLHVSYSADGRNFVSCSKDGWVKVWWSGDQATLAYQHDMKTYQWMYTWASKYNPSDTLLMVAGVVSDIKGEIAIFDARNGRNVSSPGHVEYRLLCRINNNPYDVQGAWLSDHHFFCGRLTGNPYVMLEAAVWMCEVDPDENYDVRLTSPQIYRNLVFKFRVIFLLHLILRWT